MTDGTASTNLPLASFADEVIVNNDPGTGMEGPKRVPIENLAAQFESINGLTAGVISIVDKDLSAPPGSPTVGARYIVGPTATGAWATHEKDIAQWSALGWTFTDPTGATVYIEDEDAIYHYTGGAWVLVLSNAIAVAAAASAAAAATSADNAALSEIAALGSENAAAASALSASSSATTAQANSHLYTTIAAGRAAVADGEQFRVIDANYVVTVYQRIDASNQSTIVPGYRIAPAAMIEKDDVPGDNTGFDGDVTWDEKSKVLYPRKAAGSWGKGISLAALIAGAAAALVTNADRVLDFRDGNFSADVTVARAAVSNSGLATNLLYTDPVDYAYSTFAANEPIVRSDLGIGFFRASTNYIANSTAVVTQTTPSLTTGTYTLWALIPGGGTLSSALNSATATGVGAVTSGVPQTIVVTGAGTLDITASGAGIIAQLEKDDTLTRTGPTPLIVTGATVPATRPADFGTVGGSLLAALQGAAGSIVIETANVLFKSGLVNQLLYIDSATQLFLSNDETATYFRGATNVNQKNGGRKIYSAYTWTGNLYTNARIRTGLTWSGSTMTFGAGNYQPQDIAAAFNAGGTPSTVKIGAKASTGEQTLNGWITRITTGATRKTNAELYAACTALSRTKTVHGFSPRVSLQKLRAGLANMNAQINPHPMIFCLGDSNTAGATVATSNNYIYAWPYVLAQLLQAEGINARTTNWWGKCPNNTAIGTYRSDMVDSGTVAAYGISLGGEVLNMSAGAKRQLIIAEDTDTYEVGYYGGYGTFYIRDGAGGTILETVDSSGAAGIRKIVAASTLGARTWEIEAVGTVHLAWGRAYDSSVPGVDICNCGRSQYTIANFVQGGGVPEASIPYLLSHALLSPIGCLVDLGENDMNVGNNISTALTNLGTLHTSIATYGSAAYATFHPTNPDIGLGNVTSPYAAQFKWKEMIKGHTASVGAPCIDNWTSWGGTATGTFIADQWVAAGDTTSAVKPGPFSDALIHLGVEGHQAKAQYWADLIIQSL